MDLSEFLLARIAEDQEMATAVRDYRREREPSEGDATGGYEWDNSGMVYVAPARVLAGCAAKRRIVEHWTTKRRLADQLGGAIHHGFAQGLGHAVKDLAVPYADHPDYDPEWKP